MKKVFVCSLQFYALNIYKISLYDKTFNSTPGFYTLYAAFKLPRGFPFRSAGCANARIPVHVATTLIVSE